MARPVVRFLLKLLKIMAVLVLSLVVILAVVLFTADMSIDLYSEEDSESSVSQIHKISALDEYVVVEETNTVTLQKQEYRKILGDYPIGDTEVSLSVAAHYKYFIKLSEIQQELESRLLTITIPALYLSTPVAFDSASLVEKGENSLLGKDYEDLLAELRTTITQTLENNGKRQKSNVREKASRTIAENFNAYFSRNDYSKFYDEIEIIFKDDRRHASSRYVFNEGFCGTEPCRLELEIIEGKTVVIE